MIECVNEAIYPRGISTPVVIHSDPGSQYVSKRYHDLLKGDLVASYSRKEILGIMPVLNHFMH